jgi:hypothetical protein
MTMNPQHDTSDDLERQVVHNINEFGWHAVNVIEDDAQPPWTYTIGFHDTWNHPELIIIGRSRATAHHILETIATGLDHDRRLDLTTTAYTLLPGTPCFLLEVADRYYSDYVGFAAGTTAVDNSLSTKSCGPTTTVTILGARVPQERSRNGSRYSAQPQGRPDFPLR